MTDVKELSGSARSHLSKRGRCSSCEKVSSGCWKLCKKHRSGEMKEEVSIDL